MKRTDLLLAAIVIAIGMSAFYFIEHMFRKTTASNNCAGKYIRIIEMSNFIGRSR
jgi:uncharacterized protein (UPF0333 family)